MTWNANAHGLVGPAASLIADLDIPVPTPQHHQRSRRPAAGHPPAVAMEISGRYEQRGAWTMRIRPERFALVLLASLRGGRADD